LKIPHEVNVATRSATGLYFNARKIRISRPSINHTNAKSKKMTVIWGLDLAEMQWGKFKGSYMFNQVYHLRRTKMIVYQIAMILCVVSESVGTAALSGQFLVLK
jgi:hypothetical protein